MVTAAVAAASLPRRGGSSCPLPPPSRLPLISPMWSRRRLLLPLPGVGAWRQRRRLLPSRRGGSSCPPSPTSC
ncbi:Os02g0474000 [Oryza sativa Japonica Group]|uniref:Os02g0474000 protein n=1 Tax=Oryza sativa subsp. japonica TaxID=39947 RepID=Q0E186_ORYSJ|nr:hypothetical protein OsJ_06709 [Oryza sativa Japonica Group]BAD21987.1 unknown protein [Oryza sativa Japonica Group]BAF08752.1 Os02g0474000 [Oryza sativa Japonica Group]|eukprot:NP_001046838.1 Os02g0474000 [Oryza sativa Japonica Group]